MKGSSIKKRWAKEDAESVKGWVNYDPKGRRTTSNRRTREKEIKWTYESSPRGSPLYTKDPSEISQARLQHDIIDTTIHGRFNPGGLTDVQLADLKAIMEKPYQSWWKNIPTTKPLTEKGLIEWKETNIKGRLFGKNLKGYCVTEKGKQVLAQSGKK